MEDLKELVIAILAGVAVHYLIEAIDEATRREKPGKHTRRDR